jgi:hypothetical protein
MECSIARMWFSNLIIQFNSVQTDMNYILQLTIHNRIDVNNHCIVYKSTLHRNAVIYGECLVPPLASTSIPLHFRLEP